MYLVSRLGEIFSRFTDNFLKLSESKTGYLVVNIRKNGKRQPEYVHRLVAEVFIPNPENKPQVNHKDGNKHNNCVSNLEWVSDAENKEHAVKTGLILSGDKLGRSRYTEEQVREICNLFQSGKSIGEVIVSVNFHTTRSTLLNIRSRRDWQHVSREYVWTKHDKYINTRVKCND